MRKLLTSRWTKRAVFLLCLLPSVLLVYRALTGRLGANPISEITLTTGDWTLYFLFITLSVTPARRILKQPDLIRFRKMFGLYAFYYACLHFLTLIVFDHFFNFAEIMADVYKRPFITVGFSAFVLMIPLAVTSTAKMIRRLGRNWQRLHRLIYATALLGVIHYYWLVKSDVTLPFRFAVILGILLTFRVFFWWQARQAKRSATLASNQQASVAR